MRVVGLPEFLRCMEHAVRTSQDETDLKAFLGELSLHHQSAEMRADSIRIEGTPIRLWATKLMKLSSGEYRATWRYGERDDEEVIVCFTLAEF